MIFAARSYIIDEHLIADTESCPSWSKEHDWKSCKRQKRFEGSNPLLSARNIGYSVCCTLYFFDKTARNSNPYNLLQDEVLSKEVYNRIVCGANSRANEVSRVPCSLQKVHRNFDRITVCFFCIIHCVKFYVMI